LWQRLRDRRAHFKFRRQHPIGSYVLDFFCPEARLAVEVDGRQHARLERIARDRQRSSWLRLHGIEVLRVPAAEVEGSVEDVLQGIWQACEKRRTRR
jgi:very-short-patch-repair endonuclease